MAKTLPPAPEAQGDPKQEIDALMAVVRALEPLSKNQRERVLRYLRDFFGLYLGDS
jgi:hypothetical protein